MMQRSHLSSMGILPMVFVSKIPNTGETPVPRWTWLQTSISYEKCRLICE